MLRGELLERPTYRFLQTINEGNTGVCYRGTHDIYQCEVVQKTISTLGMDDALATEPQILKQVRHERIVEVWEAQWDPDYKAVRGVTFVMPYLDGGSVHGALQDGDRFSVRQVTQIADDVLVGLDALHAQHRLLHRDVKPGNILLESGRGRAVLGDLGSAARIDPDCQGADAHLGSPLYKAPEAGSTGVVTVQSELFSLGTTLVEMLNGPFPYDTLDADEIDQRLEAGRRALADRHYVLGPSVPRPLMLFIRRLCQPMPSRRPTDAAAALRTLRDLRLVDWQRTDGRGLVGTWRGTWPPNARVERQRIHEVTVEEISRGPNRGKLAASARWRTPMGHWRNHASLRARLPATAGELGRFFDRVDLAAQSAPTR